KPRDLLGEVLLKNLGREEPDASLMRITFKGKQGGIDKELTYQLIDYYDYDNQITSMMRTTGFSISIIAQMLGRGEISVKGAFPPELSVPPERFLEELDKRGISISESSR
ncbi:MAG: saccharopine dehydrogenase family protein, partial [Acidobacteriota bacterium]